ncbi:Nascent polypeptide-associated complex subunit alpha-like protein 2 [Hibiscus syriacus]|uniref:Nascent polypeptide-associated complex subunit alpha-like protein 2 n=1 Tax=Hibiscus syriacus TaxID=106335 RepID=A0A6A3CT46_HIBSY|nr:Nascent polypeptide-associated complex subunit alpha-like protein 2 [Hibiscus syriacus]
MPNHHSEATTVQPSPQLQHQSAVVDFRSPISQGFNAEAKKIKQKGNTNGGQGSDRTFIDGERYELKETDAKGENKDDLVDESHLRSIFCLKKIVVMKRVKETDDCFILDFNPFNPVDVAKLSAANDGDVDEELSVVAERGQETCNFKNREKSQIWHLIPVHALMILETRIMCAGFFVSVILQYDLQLDTLQL